MGTPVYREGVRKIQMFPEIRLSTCGHENKKSGFCTNTGMRGKEKSIFPEMCLGPEEWCGKTKMFPDFCLKTRMKPAFSRFSSNLRRCREQARKVKATADVWKTLFFPKSAEMQGCGEDNKVFPKAASVHGQGQVDPAFATHWLSPFGPGALQSGNWLSACSPRTDSGRALG